ncbi:MAG: hypothetical protein H0X69_13340 [Gemmatimonadales bacterium]|nr:hypothetical protein [Gemmatimonadales bacterium]
MPLTPPPVVAPSVQPTSAEVAILWLTAGLGCDGDTIAMTAATQPSIEDLLSGAIPWTPRVKLYNPFLASEVGDEFVEFFHRGARGELAEAAGFDWDAAMFNIQSVRPGMVVLGLSAKTGAGMTDLLGPLEAGRSAARGAAVTGAP